MNTVFFIVCIITGEVIAFFIGVLWGGHKTKTLLSDLQAELQKNTKLNKTLVAWIKSKIHKNDIEKTLHNMGFNSIAVYGMGYIGELFIEELKDSSITVKYAIDKRADIVPSSIDVYTISDNLGSVDAIIVTAIGYFSEIEHDLKEKVNCAVIPLEKIFN